MNPLQLLGHNPVPTRRIALAIDGAVFDEWTRVSIERDVSETTGSFQLELRDSVRSLATWPYASNGSPTGPFRPGMKARISIDGELVLVGWIEDVNPQAQEGSVYVSVSGRDKTGDLVDSAAAAKGPTEFKGLNVLQFAERIAKPFGLKVRADVDVGEPFDRLTIDAGETALSAIEKAARQRAVLMTSDGVEGLVLTRSGKRRAAGDLTFPGNVQVSSGKFSARERFSKYVVKGQAEKAAGARAKAAPLDATAPPLAAPLPIPPGPSREEGGVALWGEADDDEVTRHRPAVFMTRTASTAKSAKTQAEWRKRNARAKGDKLDYLVRGYRGDSGALWRPNTLAFVDDSFQQVTRDMLIAGVCFMYDERGEQTKLRLTGPESYDMENEGKRRQNKSRGKGSKGSKASGGGSSAGGSGGLDGTAEAL